jgi:pimeloyl-ACP methyl ester carboxylesterase
MMSKAENRMSNGRRTIIKNFAAAATVAASSAMFTNAQAKEQRSYGAKNTKDLPNLPIPKQASVTEGVLSLSGGAGLYYWDTGGDGPVVVLSHPGRGSALTWPYQQPVFAKKGFRTIAYSRRGYYGSPAGSKEDKGNYADDLHALMTHLHVDKFHILGLAAGGFSVSDYAISYPEKLLRIVIACSLFGRWDKNIDERLDFILPKEFSDLPPEFKELGASYRWANPEGVEDWIKMEKKSKGNGPRYGQKAKSKITWEKFRSINVPMFFIAGGADLYQPPSMMRAAAREIPNSKTLVIAEAGHAVQWEQPEIFNKVVTDFFSKHSE